MVNTGGTRIIIYSDARYSEGVLPIASGHSLILCFLVSCRLCSTRMVYRECLQGVFLNLVLVLVLVLVPLHRLLFFALVVWLEAPGLCPV